MKKYVVIADADCNLEKSQREKYGIDDYVPMVVTCEGKEIPVDLEWEDMSVKEYYDVLRSGKRILTTQITAEKYKSVFEKHLKEGLDVLYIGMSSALSSSLNVSYKVRDELMAQYPDRKVICVDSLNGCFGHGILCIRAAELREEGLTIEENAAWLEKNRNTVNQEGTVDSLKWLRMAGRVSGPAALFGGLLQIKPIVISDSTGHNAAVEKVKGRKTSIMRVVERTAERYEEVPYQRIFVMHADCLDEAEFLKAELEKVLPASHPEIEIGPVIHHVGASVGPGMMGVYFFGKEVTYNSESK